VPKGDRRGLQLNGVLREKGSKPWCKCVNVILCEWGKGLVGWAIPEEVGNRLTSGGHEDKSSLSGVRGDELRAEGGRVIGSLHKQIGHLDASVIDDLDLAWVEDRLDLFAIVDDVQAREEGRVLEDPQTLFRCHGSDKTGCRRHGGGWSWTGISDEFFVGAVARGACQYGTRITICENKRVQKEDNTVCLASAACGRAGCMGRW